MVRQEQRTPFGRHVLEALLFDPEPVAVVEVEHRLDEAEDALGAPPVVYLAGRLGARGQVAQEPRRGGVDRWVTLVGDGDLKRVGERIEGGRGRARFLGAALGCERSAEERAVGA